MKQRITKRNVDKLKPGQSIADTECIGFTVKCLKSGNKGYYKRYYNEKGAQCWYPLGVNLAPDQARRQAKRMAGLVAGGNDPAAERRTERKAVRNSLNVALDAYLAHEATELRSVGLVTRNFLRWVRPRLGSWSVYDLKRPDLVNLFDHIEKTIKATRGTTGRPTADQVRNQLNAAFIYWSERDDDFNNPLTRSVKQRTKAADRRPGRLLSDDEIQDLQGADRNPGG